jgi:hypothetical protein
MRASSNNKQRISLTTSNNLNKKKKKKKKKRNQKQNHYIYFSNKITSFVAKESGKNLAFLGIPISHCFTTTSYSTPSIFSTISGFLGFA